MSKRQHAAISVLGLLFPLVAPVYAQTSGEITGKVVDSSGAVVPGTNVTITNVATSQTRQVQTNDTGNYSAPFLPPGTYNVRAEKQGFKAATRNDIRLQVADSLRVDFGMELGSITEAIVVDAAAPLLTTESGTVGTVIDNKRIVELPLNGRNYLQMVALSPNVSAEQGAGGIHWSGADSGCLKSAGADSGLRAGSF